MVALAVSHEAFSNHPSGTPTPSHRDWTARLPVMRSFPRLAVERAEESLLEARWDEEPERWDGMA